MIAEELIGYGLVFVVFLSLSYVGVGRRIGGAPGRLLAFAVAILLTVGTMHYREPLRSAGLVGVLILVTILGVIVVAGLHRTPSTFQRQASNEVATAGNMERSLKNLHGVVLRDGEEAIPQARQVLRSLSVEDDALMAYIQDLQQMTERVKRLDVGRYGDLRRESRGIRDWWVQRKLKKEVGLTLGRLGLEEKLGQYEELLRSTEDHTRNWLKLAESYLNSGSRATAAEYIERARSSVHDVKGIAKNLRKIELKLEALGLLSGRGRH